jgi:hypothetical protein
MGTLAAAFVCGVFDAVLLLPAPTFFVFAALGALLPPPARAVIYRPLGSAQRAFLSLGAVVLTLGVGAATAGQLNALVLTQQSTSRRTVAEALTWDPGDYRLYLLSVNRGNCGPRASYARELYDLLPYHPAAKRARRACGVR